MGLPEEAATPWEAIEFIETRLSPADADADVDADAELAALEAPPLETRREPPVETRRGRPGRRLAFVSEGGKDPCPENRAGLEREAVKFPASLEEDASICIAVSLEEPKLRGDVLAGCPSLMSVCCG